MNFMKWFVFGLLMLYILIAMFSCSPERRMARIVKKHPELLVKDTLLLTDTTIIKGSSVDSLFTFSKDTIVISDSNQTIKYFYNTVTHQNYIKGEVKERTVVKEIRVPYEKIVVKELTWWQEHKDWIFMIALFIILMLILFRK